jgi:hypothetical protein
LAGNFWLTVLESQFRSDLNATSEGAGHGTKIGMKAVYLLRRFTVHRICLEMIDDVHSFDHQDITLFFNLAAGF